MHVIKTTGLKAPVDMDGILKQQSLPYLGFKVNMSLLLI